MSNWLLLFVGFEPNKLLKSKRGVNFVRAGIATKRGRKWFLKIRPGLYPKGEFFAGFQHSFGSGIGI